MEPTPRAPYGLVLVCPKCPPKDYFGMLKTPGNKSAPCPNCGAALVAKRRKAGQALVEFALILPLLLFILLGAMEAGFLLIAKAHQDRATSVVAEWVAAHPGDSWNSISNRELPGCSVVVTAPSRDLVEASSRCQYSAKVLVGFPIFSGIPISSQETAVESRDPDTSPDASPSS